MCSCHLYATSVSITMLTHWRLAGGLAITKSLEETTLPFTDRKPSILNEEPIAAAMMSGSESELSDVPEPPAPAVDSDRNSSTPPPYGNGHHADDSNLSDEEDGLAESDDADFEVKSQTPEPAPLLDNSSSEESLRPAKRKTLGIEDDEDIMNNPELYGIRRSVSILGPVVCLC